MGNGANITLRRWSVALLWIVTSHLVTAEDSSKSGSQRTFHLGGNAFMGSDNIVSLTITNESPGGNDYLIEYGEITVVDLVDGDSKQGLRLRMDTVLTGGPLKRVAASKHNLLTGDQMMRMEFKLPQEYKDARIDFVQITLRLCETPITGKRVVFSSSKVTLPLRRKASE